MDEDEDDQVDLGEFLRWYAEEGHLLAKRSTLRHVLGVNWLFGHSTNQAIARRFLVAKVGLLYTTLTPMFSVSRSVSRVLLEIISTYSRRYVHCRWYI
jgi:hypothetical protein